MKMIASEMTRPIDPHDHEDQPDRVDLHALDRDVDRVAQYGAHSDEEYGRADSHFCYGLGSRAADASRGSDRNPAPAACWKPEPAFARTHASDHVDNRPSRRACAAARGCVRERAPVRALPGRGADHGERRHPRADARRGEGPGRGHDQGAAELGHGRASRPHQARGSTARDPSQYPGWARYDDTIAAIKAHGFKVMVALAPPAPGWATRQARRPRGRDRPNAREFGRFAEAAARRYPGVDVWTLWNEPNHPRHLYPQSTKGGRPVAPRIYRAMVRAAVAGLRRGGSRHDPILFGELLPIGKPVDGPKRNLQPLRFLRAFFRGKPLSGLAGFAYHPYTRPAGPLNREPTANDATIRSFGRVLTVLDQARASGKLKSKKKLPIWNTEFGFQTNPPDPLRRPDRRVPRFWALSELWFSYSNRRVKTISQYTMDDQPGSASLWQSGLRFANGASSPTSTRTTACRSSCASSARARSRCAARRGRAAPARRSRSSSALAARAPSSRWAARSACVTCAATSWPASRISKAGFRTFYFTTGGQSSLQGQARAHLLMTLNPIVTLRRTMSRFIACLVAAAVLTGCGFAAAPQKSEAAVLVGIGEQNASMFSNPLFTQIGFKRARYFPSWNVAQKPQEAAWLDQWLRRRAGAGCRAADLVLRRARLVVPVEAVQAADGQPVHEGVQGLPRALAAGEGDQPMERGEPPLAADVQEPEARGAVLQRRAQVLPRLQDHRGRRHRRDEHGAVAEGLQEDGEEAEDLGPPQLPRHEQAQGPAAWAARSACSRP